MAMISPHLARILVYPIKSLDGEDLQQVQILPSGALRHDREYAFVDDQGQWVNGKRTAAIHRLRSHFDINSQLLTLQIQGTAQPVTFHVHHGRVALETWLKDYFGIPITLVQDIRMGFPDDPVANGPTVISTATIREVASWFPGSSEAEIRRRFRANLEIDGVPAFWEDQLFGEAEQGVEFQIGAVVLEGVNPCQRCIVPTRDSQTGDATAQFQKTFNRRRRETLPDWVAKTRFNHFYRLSVNTTISPAGAGQIMAVGDRVQVLGPTTPLSSS